MSLVLLLAKTFVSPRPYTDAENGYIANARELG